MMGQRCTGEAGCGSFNTRRLNIEQRPPTVEQRRWAVDRLAGLVVYFSNSAWSRDYPALIMPPNDLCFCDAGSTRIALKLRVLKFLHLELHFPLCMNLCCKTRGTIKVLRY